MVLQAPECRSLSPDEQPDPQPLTEPVAHLTGATALFGPGSLTVAVVNQLVHGGVVGGQDQGARRPCLVHVVPKALPLTRTHVDPTRALQLQDL